ncbi:transketolase, thiamine diphosphate binding domain protein [Anaplasma phagocytophilum str. ApNP]|uniref:Transketolase, thiamine diphosphate binding domain protein n=1 Tax=Anaplasma phagocytophilum str. ApNP TaxID=1359153 RepID=A0A0F3NE38_ANAPH|nr:transketolase, thiamine diphosphate binding domain protein [Anaplasma phagocytophilum str. ApNP]
MQYSTQLTEMASAIRLLSIDAIQNAASGHPGMPLGMADVAAVLFSKFLRFSVQNPNWINRDRLVMSNGHGSMLIYSIY